MLNIGQAKVVIAYGSSSETFSVTDTATRVNTDRADGSITGAASVTLSGAATVAEAANLAELGISYAIGDTAAAVQAALDTANAASATDRELIEGATSITLSTNATVAEALGVAGADRGLYTVDGLSYSITDSVTNLVAGLSSIDSAGIGAATLISTNSTAAFTVAQAATWTSLSNFDGHTAAASGRYYVEDTHTNVMAADTTLISDAFTVVANGTTGVDTINLSMHTKGMTINGDDGDDIITGTSGADTIVGGDDADTITGGAGADAITVSEGDTVVIGAGDTGITEATADEITGFTSGTDKIDFAGAAGTAANYDEATADVADFAAGLTAANTALDGTHLYSFQTDGTDGFLFFDNDADGTADEVIILVGIDEGGIALADIIA